MCRAYRSGYDDDKSCLRMVARIDAQQSLATLRRDELVDTHLRGRLLVRGRDVSRNFGRQRCRSELILLRRVRGRRGHGGITRCGLGILRRLVAPLPLCRGLCLSLTIPKMRQRSPKVKHEVSYDIPFLAQPPWSADCREHLLPYPTAENRCTALLGTS